MSESESNFSHDASVDIRSRLAAIVDSSNDAIISINLDGVISTWNPAAQLLFGYSEREAVGQPITTIIPADWHDEEREIIRRVRLGQRTDNYETLRVTRDGRTLDVSITASPIRNAAGAIVGASKILRDITESKRDRAALRESERRLAIEVRAARALQSISTRLISESSQESLFGQIVEAAMELMSSDAASLHMLAPDGKSLTLIGWKNLHLHSAAFWREVTAEGRSTCGVALRENKRVTVADVEAYEFMAGTEDLAEYRRSGLRAAQSTPLRSRIGSLLGMISTHWNAPHAPTEDDFRLFDVLARQAADLIERTRAEEALRESEERFRLIASTAPVIIWMSDANRTCTYVNQTLLDLTGQSFDATAGNGWTEGIHPGDFLQCGDTYARALERREPFHLDLRVRRHDDEYRWIVTTGTPRYHADGSFAGYIGCAIDTTERRLAAEALATIDQRLIEAHEEERRRIARELHDDILQRLALVTISLDALAQTGAAPASNSKQELEETRDTAMDLARDVQALSHRLHPGRLEFLGISAAAAGLCREMSKVRAVEIRFHAESVPDGLAKRVAVCLYRVLQEALQNAVKHSGVREIEVALRGGVDEIELSVRDRGAGFDVPTGEGRGLGLTSMKERVRAVRGRLAILSEPQVGTTIYASVPLAWDD